MDTSIRTNSGAPLITPWSPRGMSTDKFNAIAAADARKSKIESAAQKAFDLPVMKAADKDKNYIRQRIEGIKERLKILQKMYSGNPKQMAHALAQVFKELKAALKDFKAATDREMGASSSAADAAQTAGVPAEPAAPPKDDAEQDDADKAKADDAAQTAPAQAEAAPETKQAETAPADAQPQTKDPTGLYTAVDRKVKEIAGDDGLDFLKLVKGLVKQIEEKLLAPARIQKAAQKPDKSTNEAFEDVEKTLKDLHKDMEDMDRDIKQAVPGIGQKLDIAA